MTPNSLLLRELLRIARERNWSLTDLAEQLGVHSTLLMHVRGGRRRLTLDLLARVARTFGDVPSIRELVWHYLVTEVAEFEDAKGEVAIKRPLSGLVDAEKLDATARRKIQSFASKFLVSHFHGRGLYVFGSDASLLRGAVRLLREHCAAREIQAVVTDGAASLSKSAMGSMIRAPLVIIERIEFASPTVKEVVMRRADLVKPVSATGMCDSADLSDPYVARICKSTMSPVRVTPVSLTKPAHAEA